jgi:hypothetical protein
MISADFKTMTCDALGCDRHIWLSFPAHVPDGVRRTDLLALAVKEGWGQGRDRDKHLCPEHAVKENQRHD